MAKYKYILTLIITLFAVTTFAQPAQYTPMTAAGYQMKRLKVDSTLHLPSFCGVPTIRGSVAKEGALAIDTCGGLLYMWTRTAGWDTVNTSGGGGSSTDTTSLSNRINLKIDSLKRSNDSVYAWINGTRVFQFTDSVGSGGGDFWKTSDFTSLTNNVQIRSDNSIQFAGIDDELKTFAINAVDYNFSLQGGAYKIEGLNSQIDTSFYKPLVIGTDNNIQRFPYWVGGGGANDTTKVPYTGATKDVNIGTHDLFTNKVYLYDEPNDNYGSIHYTDGDFHVEDADNHKLLVIEDGFMQLHLNDTIQSNIFTTSLTQTRNHTLPNASGTFALTSDTISLSNRINTKLNATDTASLSNRINSKLSSSDTASLSNRINGKLTIGDTTVFQRKSLSANTIMANNTSATANATAQQFRDTSGVYSGTITWTGTTAPSGATTHTYRLTQVGKCVTLHIALVYASNGAALTAVTLTLPSGAPTPVQPTGLTSASSNMYPVNGQLASSANNSILSAASRGFLRNNAVGNAFDILLNFGSIAPGQLGVTVQYWTN